jgi:small subunit ribosomal protein S3
LGHKVHPTGFRIGVIKDWHSKWYSETNYAEFVQEDNRLREEIKNKYREAAISMIEIDRQAKDVTVTLYTARPGIVIGRGGQRVDEMRQHLEKLIGKKIRLNIQEIRQPELDAYLVARSVAEQIERRVAYRRAMKQAIFRTIQAGAKGIKVSCAGRLGNAEIARRQTSHEGQVPLHTLRADIDYGFTEAQTTLGRIGVKVWIYKGQILPEIIVPEVEETPEGEVLEETTAEAVTEVAPAPEVEEKPAEAVAEVAPAPEVEEKPAEAVTEIAPAPEAEEKPAEAVTETAPAPKAEEKPAEAVAKTIPAPEAEEKPAKKATKAKPAAKAEKKPAATKEAKTTKATAKKETVKKTTKAASAKEETAEKPAPKPRKKAVKATEPEAEAAEAAPDKESATDDKEETKDAAA